MSAKKVRIPEDDFTFWLDADGSPQHRGATKGDAAQKVQEVAALAEMWLQASQLNDDGIAKRNIEAKKRAEEFARQERAFNIALSKLSAAEQSNFRRLRERVQELQSVKSIRINADNVTTILALSPDIKCLEAVKVVLAQWARLYIK